MLLLLLDSDTDLYGLTSWCMLIFASAKIIRYGDMKKSSYTQAKGSREKDKRYNQLLVIRDNYPRTNIRQVSWLTDPCRSRLPGFPVTFWPWLPVYSDEIAQDFHLLLFYPFAESFLFLKRHLIFSYLVFSCWELQTAICHPHAYHSTLFFKVQVVKKFISARIKYPVACRGVFDFPT